MTPEQELTPDNALIVGTAMHEALENGIDTALHNYFMTYPISSDAHETEALKIELMEKKARELLPKGGAFEVEISTPDFIGYLDYVVPVGKREYDIYDFKYTSKFDRYRYSAQLHLYKYFFEKCYPRRKIRNLYYLLIPKVGIKQKATESIIQYRQRIRNECDLAGVDVMEVQYDPEKVIKSLLSIKKAQESKNFKPKENEFCYFCEYKNLCEKIKKEGKTMSFQLPENKRRDITGVTRRTMWLYGLPFSGKTTFANEFPEPLMLNTDGNTKYVDAPVIHIKDQVTTTGRITSRKFAWEMFEDVISELEKKENTFKTIVVDLLEDLYEHCRLYMYDEMGVTHESDDPFRTWDKITQKFLGTLKRLMNLDYENIILISHERTAKDITKRSGDKITAITPNLREKVALKIAGMVDIVARIVSEDGKRTFTFKSDDVIFGGGRLKVDRTEIPLDVKELFEVYKVATEAAAKKSKRKSNPLPEPEEIPFDSERADEIAAEVEAELIEEESRDRAEALAKREQEQETTETERPRRRSRRKREADEEE